MDEGKFKLTITATVHETSRYGNGKQWAIREFSVIADDMLDLHTLALAVQGAATALPVAVVMDAGTEIDADKARFEAAQAMKATQTDGDN